MNPFSGTGALPRAIDYALGSIEAVTPDLLGRPTPCRRWDLRMLLRHTCESMTALHEGLVAGRVGLEPAPDDETAADPARMFRERAHRLRAAWVSAGGRRRDIEVVDCPLADSVMAGAGALEIAVHGWDISQACGQYRPIPPDLALDLLALSALLVPESDRQPLFAAPAAVTPAAGPSELLIAFLGRTGDGVRVGARRRG